ncbi:MAG: tetratricopeptide repeat protein [Anaerolineae bacterium]
MSRIPLLFRIVFAVLLVVLVATVVDGRRLFTLAQRWLGREDAASAVVADAAAWATDTNGTIARLQARLKQQPDDARSMTQLGGAYLQKARETGDPSYYGRAEAVLKQALARNPSDIDALGFMGSLALSRHQFREALQWGEKARAISPERAYTYGVLGDAHVELGEYAEAADAIQAMMNRRPDLSSFSRVSYVRELHGDIPGAIDAMEQAIVSGGPNAENTAWATVQLGLLYFNQGQPDKADAMFTSALASYPGYIPAQAGRARVLAARGQWDDAIALLRQAVDTMPMPEYVILLGDVYMAAGRDAEAAQQYDLVRAIQQLYKANGVEVDLETALFDADHDHDLPNALASARRGYADRPSIHGADVLAWTLLKAGQPGEAQQMMQQALRLGTRDALMYYHAGMIALANGDSSQAETYLARAMEINPHFSVLQAPSALKVLDGLRTAKSGDERKGS